MVYVKRDQDGHVVSVSLEQQPDGWESLPREAPELVTFISALTVGQKELAFTDLDLIRVLEDFIDLLLERDVIRFTDFPEAAQEKLLARRSMRSSLHSLKLFGEEGEDRLL